jgi:hypothetical protein
MLTVIAFIVSLIAEICALVMMFVLYYRMIALMKLVLRYLGKE